MLSDPMVLYDADGAERHRNRALRTLLAVEPDATGLMRAARALTDAGRSDENALASARRQLDLTGGHYRLRLGRTPLPLFDEQDTLVLVERASRYPPPTVLQNRFGLTPREAEVTLLLSRGLSNDDIADRLVISPHTARHHVQKVLQKLDVSTRTAVSHTLLERRT